MTARNSAEKRRMVRIGFRGCGKSTLVAKLSRQTGMNIFSTDQLIVEQESLAICKIVAQKGWKHFRQIEAMVIDGLKDRFGVIIDCSGGVVENPENMSHLQNNSWIVCVDADTDVLESRLQEFSDCPLLTHDRLKKDILTHYRRRLPLYRRYADLRVDSSLQSLEVMCSVILQSFMSRRKS